MYLQHTVIFTITKGDKGYNITSVTHSPYNYIGIPGFRIFQAMEELADTFNNKLKLGILFEIA